jgi:hypothetical protein
MSDTLIIKIDPRLKQLLRDEAKRRRTSMSMLTRRVLREYLEEIEAREEFSRWLESVRGSGTSGLTTDEIMELTRGE